MQKRPAQIFTLKFALAAGLLEAALQLILVAAALSSGQDGGGWPDSGWLWGNVLLPAVRSGGLLGLGTWWWVSAWAGKAAVPARPWRLLLAYLALAQLLSRGAGLLWTRCVSWPVAEALQGNGVPPANIDLYIGPVNALAQAALMVGFSLLAWRLALRVCRPRAGVGGAGAPADAGESGVTALASAGDNAGPMDPPATSARKAALFFAVYMLLLHLLAGQFVLQMLSLGTMALVGQAAWAFGLAALLVAAIVYVAARRRLRTASVVGTGTGPAAARAFFTLYTFWLVLLMLLQTAAWLAAATSEAMLAPLLGLGAIYLIAAYPISSRAVNRILGAA
jgi:hypothetical protein